MRNITTVILAGGKSKRMGKDKAFLLWKGKPFIRHILEFVDNFSNQIIISGNKDPEIYIKETNNLENNVIVVEDIDPYSGPLNAVASCTDYINNSLVFLVTCDTPILNINICKYLYDSLKDFHCVIPVINGKFQPFNTFYTKEAFFIGKDLYLKGKKSLYNWIETLNAKYIYSDELKIYDEKLLMFKSINRPEEYEQFIKEN